MTVKANQHQIANLLSEEILPPISIIMSWFNTPIFEAERAVNSVIRQDYEGLIELVICNDGSDPSMMKKLAIMLQNQSWGNVTYNICQHPRRLGASAARNSAVRSARGDWLIWLDADDELAPSAVRQMVAVALEQKVGLVTSRCWFIKNQQRHLRKPEVYLPLARLFHKTIFDPLALVVFSLHPQLLKRELFEELSGFNTSYKFAQVTDFFLRFVSRYSLANTHHIDHPLYFYYRGEKPPSYRQQMNRKRREALLQYASQQCLPIQDIRYIGRCIETGALHYLPVVDGQEMWPPYLKKPKAGADNQRVELCL